MEVKVLTDRRCESQHKVAVRTQNSYVQGLVSFITEIYIHRKIKYIVQRLYV